MFEDIEDIYECIGQEMFDVLPESFDAAYSYATILMPGRSVEVAQKFVDSQGKEHQFSTFIQNDQVLDTNLPQAFLALLEKMAQEGEIPWNKAAFSLTEDGDFELEFKLDDDWEYVRNLDSDSLEYDLLDVDLIDQVKSWEGLPDEVERPWSS